MKQIRQAVSGMIIMTLTLFYTLAQDYSESPMLAEQVASGALPPLAERLPVNPAVMVPLESNGDYSEDIFVFVPSAEPWATLQEETERGSYLGFINQNNEVVPNLAESLELADDFKSLTIKLREGTKWSDGHPFTADDIMFAFEAWHFDSRTNEGAQPFWLNKVRRAIKVDDYTVRLETDEPYPVMLAKMGEPAGGDWHAYLPKHYMEQFHIDYNPDADKLAVELGYDNWIAALNAHEWEFENGFSHIINDGYVRPTMQPWMLTEVTDTTKVHLRNPYYWKVDSEGRQLPYIDRIVAGVADPETINLKIVAGEVDLDYGVASVTNYSLYKENEAAGDFRTIEIQTQGTAIVAFWVNQTVDNPVKRSAFQDLRFRQALSLAIDANEINEIVYFGLGRPMAFPVTGTSFHMDKWDENPVDAYDVKRANQLLDEAGLDAKNSDGWRLGSDGEVFTMNIEVSTGGEGSASLPALELIKEYWEAVGLQTNLSVIDGALLGERAEANAIEVGAGVWDYGSEARQYMIDREFWAHGSEGLTWAQQWGEWLMADIEIKECTRSLEEFTDGVLPGEEPPQAYKDLFDWNEARSKTVLGSPEYIELSQKIFDFHFENLLMQGVVGGLPSLAIAKNNLGNVPTEYFGSAIWFGDLNITADQLFFK